MQDSFPTFDKELYDLEQIIDRLPDIIGNAYLNFIDENFAKEGFQDTTFQKWNSRNKNEGKQRNILVKSGRLRRSPRYRRQDMTVIISTDVPYAKIHNEGGKGTVTVKAHKRTRNGNTHNVKSHSRTISMTQRQFMGESGYFNKEVTDWLTKELDGHLK